MKKLTVRDIRFLIALPAIVSTMIFGVLQYNFLAFIIPVLWLGITLWTFSYDEMRDDYER